MDLNEERRNHDHQWVTPELKMWTNGNVMIWFLTMSAGSTGHNIGE